MKVFSNMATTKDDIRGWFEAGVEQGATHMLVVCDTFSYEDYPVYVRPDQIMQVVYEEHDGPNMQRVMEVYDLRDDMESQLKERRAFSV
jgi:hypothetical protein